MKLLICIAFHYNPERLKYLNQVINNFLQYDMEVTIIVDTNTFDFKHDKVNVFVHEDLSHPFYLTWIHRIHIKDEINNYDYFMYIEDDMYLPFENFKNYLENFKLLWPKYVPSFVRIETDGKDEFISDATDQHKTDENIISIGGKLFTSLKFPQNYHAFWIMPQKELKETMKNDFVRLNDGREFAASYPMWELNKKPLIEVYNRDCKYRIDPVCFSYHLPNNYALSPNSKQAKIKQEDIFI